MDFVTRQLKDSVGILLFLTFATPAAAALEPFPLVLLELVCWAGVLLVVGLTISGVDRLFHPPLKGPNQPTQLAAV